MVLAGDFGSFWRGILKLRFGKVSTRPPATRRLGSDMETFGKFGEELWMMRMPTLATRRKMPTT